MLDIKFIRENPEKVEETLKNKGIRDISVHELLQLDSQRTNLLQRVEQHRALRNQLTKDISLLEKGPEREKLVEEARGVKEELNKIEEEFEKVSYKFQNILIKIPNITSPEMPVGKGEEDNVVLKVWVPDVGFMGVGNTSYSDVSYMPEKGFDYKDHVELGEDLDLIDIKQSAVVSGARFYYLKNEGVLLQEAVFKLLKDYLREKEYMPIIPPVLVREQALYGTSHFPEGKEDVYKIESFNVEEQNELYLVGSSEPANFAYFMDKTFDEEELPIKLYAQSVCFRSEAGSWGKDVRGIKRVHQFDKVEMNSICKPAESRKIFNEFLEINQWMLQKLKLPYRIVNKCTGDSGYNASHLQYDYEYWRPSEREFMEGGTNTLATDYQARRLNIRYRSGDKLNYVHTVNDTGVATRVIIAILENYQQEDGSIVVPEVLREYMGRDKILPKQAK